MKLITCKNSVLRKRLEHMNKKKCSENPTIFILRKKFVSAVKKKKSVPVPIPLVPTYIDKVTEYQE